MGGRKIKKMVNKTKKNYKKMKRRNFFILFLYFCLAGFFLSAISLMTLIVYSSKDLPSIESVQNYKANFSTRIYSKDGVLLNSYGNESRIFVPIDEIPAIVKQAFIAAEDANFYNHSGVDFIGILKAAYKNAIFFAKGDGQLVGASTITQQVVKNLLLSNERTFARKFKEILLSLEITKNISKDEVLEIYLNHIYLGASAYGVMAASLEYFGKSVKELNAAEAALLAALPKAPSDINPRRRKERAIARRNWVLQRMFENRFISLEELFVLKNSDLQVVPQKKVHKVSNGVNAFSGHIKSLVSGIYGSDAFFSNGYSVITTIDYEVQAALYKAFRNTILNYDKKMGYRGNAGNIKLSGDQCQNLNQFIEIAELTDFTLKYGLVLSVNEENLKVLDENCMEIAVPVESMSWSGKKSSDYAKGGQVIVFDSENNTFSQMPEINGGAMVINPKNGDVLAMIGDFFDRPNGFNRAISAKRQIGSAIKPFVYIAALENGFAPNSILVDEDLKLSDEWQPRNSSRDFLGSITLRTALERSRNIPTVRISEMLGTSLIVKRFQDFDLNTDSLQNDLTTTLGSLSVTVEKTVKAFSVFVNAGRKPDVVYINKISDSNGKAIFLKDGECDKSCFDESKVPIVSKIEYGEKVAKEDVSFQILSMLEGATQRGTARGMSAISEFGVAGKTGSTNDHKDAWFVGLTNDLAIAVFIGNDKPKSLGEGQYGSVIALPVVRDTMLALKQSYPITPFVAPNSIEPIVVDYNTGQAPSIQTKRKITEYFKLEDKKPRQIDLTSEVVTNEDVLDTEEKIISGIY
jgi:penicillin-binding protein 1A